MVTRHRRQSIDQAGESPGRAVLDPPDESARLVALESTTVTEVVGISGAESLRVDFTD